MGTEFKVIYLNVFSSYLASETCEKKTQLVQSYETISVSYHCRQIWKEVMKYEQNVEHAVGKRCFYQTITSSAISLSAVCVCVHMSAINIELFLCIFRISFKINKKLFLCL